MSLSFGAMSFTKLIVYVKLTFGYFFKARDHAERGGLSAAGRTNKDDKFFIGNIKVKIRYRGDATGVSFEKYPSGLHWT